MRYDVVIVGGGPAGLAAALTLGRARKRVLLCDSGPRRNAGAIHVQNFVTRDGTPPLEFRAIARQQLTTYPTVEVRDVRVASIAGTRGAFRVTLDTGAVESRRALLCTGMIDELPAIDGFRELWSHAIFQCPYCHGWEIRDRRWAYLGRAAEAGHLLPFTLMLRGWTSDVVAFTGGEFELPEDARATLAAAGITLETAPVARLVARGHELEAVELSDGRQVACDALFTHPPQRHVDLIRQLDLALDEHGFVKIDPMRRETSVPGIYAAGDLTTRMQAAIHAAAAGTHAASMINVELSAELAVQGAAHS